MNIPPKYEDVVAQLGAERELHKLATETLGQFADENQKLHANLAALREELSGANEQLRMKSLWIAKLIPERDDLQQRLTVAEQRLTQVEGACDLAMSAIDDDERGANFVKIIQAIKDKAALKPAEEATGSTCNQIREESGLPTKNPCVACNNGACIDR